MKFWEFVLGLLAYAVCLGVGWMLYQVFFKSDRP